MAAVSTLVEFLEDFPRKDAVWEVSGQERRAELPIVDFRLPNAGAGALACGVRE